MKKYLTILSLNLGFISAVAQVLFLRELLSLFQGNEIIVGIVLTGWLFWTAAGSFTAGKFIKNKIQYSGILVIVLMLAALSLPLTLLLMRFAIVIIKPVPGIVSGLGVVFVFSFSATAVFCFTQGASFSIMSSFIKAQLHKSTANATGKLYYLESFGSAIAGVILSLFLLDRLDGLLLALYFSIWNGVIIFTFLARSSLFHRRNRHFVWAGALYGCVIAIIFFLSGTSQKFRWQDFPLLKSFESRYGKLSLIGSESDKILYSNSISLAAYPDHEAAEESVHFALLQHPDPVNILLIGNGVSGALEEILKHPSVKQIDYVEQDPKIIQISRAYFPEVFEPIDSAGIVQIHIMDGRRFLEMTHTKYDVIILNSAEPNSIQYNRYFTAEFYNTVRSKLTGAGIFSFRVNGSENYISSELAAYLKCMYATLNTAFGHITVYPGETIHFFGCQTPGVLTTNPDLLTQNISDRNLKLHYIREYYLPFRLTSGRIDYLERNITPDVSTPVNTDFYPIICFYNLSFWSKQYTGFFAAAMRVVSGLNLSYSAVFLFLIFIVFVIFSGLLFPGKSLLRAAASGSIFVSGFSLMGLELIALLIFQSELGYLYQQLALLLGAFMAGLGSGAALALKYQKYFSENQSKALGTLFMVHSVFIFLPLLFVYFFPVLKYCGIQGGPELLFSVVFIIALFFTGTGGGLLFPVAGYLFYDAGRQNTGALYAIDLIGAMAGLLVVNLFMIPLYGFYKAVWLISMIQLTVLIMLMKAMRQKT